MIYFVEAVGVGHIKIGFTDGDDAERRLDTLQTGSPVPIRLLGTVPGGMEEEKDLHRLFASARVHGEWFKPIPEILALIPGAGIKACGKVEIAEKSVQIKVLTVGRRQFTKSLLEQIPKSGIIEMEELDFQIEQLILQGVPVADMEKSMSAEDFVTGDVWGWTKALPVETFGPNGTYQRNRVWIIYEKAGVLYKANYFKTAIDDDIAVPRNLNNQEAKEFVTAWRHFYRQFGSLPKWSQQLFIGV